jgi:hypothetical protein
MRMRKVLYVAHTTNMRNAYQILAGNPEGKNAINT